MNQKLQDFYILVAEDDEEDRMLLQDALEESGFEPKIIFVSNGEELMDWLKHREEDCNGQNNCFPTLILLDLNMPKKDGREVLAEIKSHQNYRGIPIIVLTTSKDKEDVVKIYELGGSSFITKPSSYTSLLNIASEIKKYWLETVQLPSIAKFATN